MKTGKIYGDRIMQARVIKGLTISQMAKKIGIKSYVLSGVEADKVIPLPTIMENIVFITGFPPGFFKQEPCADFSNSSLSFHK
jgi:ribosome-binding protein aMBF1 (putative translation factor)